MLSTAEIKQIDLKWLGAWDLEPHVNQPLGTLWEFVTCDVKIETNTKDKIAKENSATVVSNHYK